MYISVKLGIWVFKSICINNSDTKNEIPVNLMIGAVDYTKIKTQESQGMAAGRINCWIKQISLGHNYLDHENSVTNLIFSKNSANDFENLWSLHVLGVKNKHIRDNETFCS